MVDQDPRAIRLGDNGWTALKVLGKGQFGIAYMVEPTAASGKAETCKIRREEESGRYYAVAKMVSLDFLSEKDNQQAGQEVTLLKQLQHPNIVSYYDHYLSEEPVRELVILMEFCEGGEMRGRIKDYSKANPPQNFPERLIMRWFCQSLSALTYVHKMHILHRDLKSSNIFLKNGDKDCAIGDFGISRVLEGTIDAAATVVGTPYYMSPEVCRSEPYSYKSDIWSLGCVLYECCMLKHAFESENLLGLVYKIVSDRYDPIPQMYSMDLGQLIARLLDKSAHSRPRGEDIMAMPYVKKHMQQLDAPSATTGSGAINYRRNQMSSDVLTGDAPVVGGAGYKKRVAPTLGPAANKRKPAPINVGGVGSSPDNFPPHKTPSHMGERNFNQGNMAAPTPMNAGAEGGRRQWTTAAGGSSSSGATVENPGMDESKLSFHLIMSRVRHAVVGQKLNWMHVFAMFDRNSSGLLNEPDFVRAMTAMHLGLSHQEIKDLFQEIKNPQGSVQVNAFAKAMNSIPNVILTVEDWGIDKLLQIGKGLKADDNQVVKGSKVRIVGLRNSPQLNGQEGVASNWDPTACRWIIQLQSGDLKAIKDANLQVLGGGGGGGGGGGSVSLYQKLCGSDPSGCVPEKTYLDVITSDSIISSERDKRRMLALAPKNVEGHIDVRALLSHEKIAGKENVVGGSSIPSTTAGGSSAAGGMATSAGTPGGGTSATPGGTPGKPPPAPSSGQEWPQSPSKKAVPPTPSGLNRTSAPFNVTVGGGGGGGGNELSLMVLWRLAQRLNNTRTTLRTVLSLFAHDDGSSSGATGKNATQKIKLDELLEAVSTCPLGVSRVEAQRVYMSLASGSPEKGVFLDKIEKAIQSAAERYGLQAPNCPDDFDRINFRKLEEEAAKMDPQETGFISAQSFKMVIMQSEPYLAGSELDWMLQVCDKDGDGNLEYPTFFWRKSPQSFYKIRWSPPHSIVMQVQSNSNPEISPSLPNDYVVKILLAKLRMFIEQKGIPNLNNILSLFPDGDKYLIEPRHQLMLQIMLAYLPFGFSKDEAVFLVKNAGGSGIGQVLAAPTGSTAAHEVITWAKSKLGPKIALLKKALVEQYHFTSDDWFMDEELINCLHIADANLSNMDHDRCILLTEKNFAGKLNAIDFWQKVSNEKNFLGAGSASAKASAKASSDKPSSAKSTPKPVAKIGSGKTGGRQDEVKPKGLCGCLGK